MIFKKKNKCKDLALNAMTGGFCAIFTVGVLAGCQEIDKYVKKQKRRKENLNNILDSYEHYQQFDDEDFMDVYFCDLDK